MQYVTLVLQILPLLINALKSIEAAIPQQGAGAQKLAAVKDILVTADSSMEQAWPVLQPVIGTLVTLFNNTGVFKK